MELNSSSYLMAMETGPQEEYVQFMEEYLQSGHLPGNEWNELIQNESKNFVLKDGQLQRKVGADGETSPYLEWLFGGDFIQRMHDEYGHLSRESIQGLFQGQA
jgi:hypothetical protein